MRVAGLLLSAAVLLSTAPAGATLIDLGGFTRDTSTGLDWLDVTATQGASVDQVFAGVGGFIAAGWSYATTAELCGLFGALGDPISNCPSTSLLVFDTLSSSSATTLTSLLGNTSFGADPGGSYGFFDSGNFSSNLAGVGCIQASAVNCFTANTDVAVALQDWTNAGAGNAIIGSFLVRPVPEPTTALLVGSGLVALGLSRSRAPLRRRPR